MRLIEWMTKSDTDIEDTARMFEVSIFAVKKWLNGERIPRYKMKAKIKRLTKGAVTGDDWIDEKR